MVEKIRKRIEITKEAIEMVSEPNLISFLKGELLGLEIALATIEKEKANENRKTDD